MTLLAKISRVLVLAGIAVHAAVAFGACPTSAPTAVSPTNGQTGVSNMPTLQWTNVGAGGKYDIYYAAGTTCPNPSTPSATEVGTSFNPPQLQNATKYSWYVIPVDTSNNQRCTGQVMACVNFTTASSSCPSNPGIPVNMSPASGATGVTSPVTFQWTAPSAAASYIVYASVNGGTPYQVGTTTSTSLTATVPQGTISWAVQAGFGTTCASTVSHATTFTVASPTVCNAPAPAPLAPANGASLATLPVTFQWSASSGAIGYQLFLQNGSDNFQDIADTTSTSVQRLVPTGTNNWYVVAKFAACPDQKSSTFQFNVPATAACTPQTSVINLTAPANGATVSSPVTFSWQAAAGAASYRIWIDLGDQNPVIVATTSSTSASVHLPAGSIEWWVEGVFASQSCGSAVSSHSKITVQGAANCGSNVTPSPVAPSGSAGTDVTFQWNGAQSATAYRVWLAPAGQPFDDIALTNHTTYEQTLTPGSYSWYVQAYYDGCPPLTSLTVQFTVTAPACPTTPPTTITPADNATGVTSPVTFTWTAVTGVKRYRVFARANDLGTHILLGETDGTTLTKALPAARIGWHVDAVFDSCPTLHSPEVHFTIPQSQNCSNTPTQLLLPADGSTVSTQPVTFDWSEVSGAGGYVLIARINDGAATALTETTDTQFTKHLPEGRVEWWVITFVSGCGTDESAHFTFTIPATNCPTTAPLLLSPRSSGVVTSPVTFAWTPVTGATRYRVWVVTSDGDQNIVASTDQTEMKVALPTGSIQWFVEAVVGTNCPTLNSAESPLQVIDTPPCATPARPSLEAPGAAVSGSRYTIRWTNVPNSASYDLQEATKANFSDATTTSLTGNSMTYNHTSSSITKYLYRVRAVSSCSDAHGRYSDVASVTILPQRPASSQQHISAEFGGTNPVVQTIFLAGKTSPVTFSATSNKPWITITPATGTLPVTGTALTVTADPKQLALGTNTGSITITYTGATSVPGGGSIMATNSTPIPLSVSLVSPVSLGGKDTPPPDSLIIPAVGHAAGIGDSLFESDVRVANTSAQVMKYQVNFTPTASDGTANGSSTTIQIDPGATLALDDILASFFGSTSTSAIGTLEIRPLTSTSSNAAFTNLSQTLTTVASSRTYNFTPNGTFGQFIPAIPFSQFIGNTSGVLSLQQIAQSAAYRTNFGLVEGAGEPATVTLTVFDNAGNVIGTIPQSLLPGEHVQLNSLLAANNISLTDGRVEVAVTSTTGRVSAYASTVDNQTNDPLMVSPVLKPSESATRFTLPGVGDFNSGFAHWKSDVRIFDSGSSDTPVTLSYYAQGKAGSPITITSSVKAGQVLALDNFIATQMPQAGTNTAGSLVVSTPSSASLVVTGRTYTDTGSGTYGQFIPAVTAADSVGLNERSLQILQLEQSSRMRSNIGIVETSGSPATAQVSVILPDSRVTPVVTLPLAANEFIQLSLGSFGYTDDIYNARVVVKVISGTGRVTAYASVIDQITQDPAYVPAQ